MTQSTSPKVRRTASSVTWMVDRASDAYEVRVTKTARDHGYTVAVRYFGVGRFGKVAWFYWASDAISFVGRTYMQPNDDAAPGYEAARAIIAPLAFPDESTEGTE